MYEFWSGRINTFNHSLTTEYDGFTFYLNPTENQEYFVSIHDPNFFMNTYTIESAPRSFFKLSKGKNLAGEEELSIN